MSQGASIPCKIDTASQTARDVAKNIIVEVLKEEGVTFAEGEQVYEPHYGDKWGYGIIVEIPREVAEKHGLRYCPDSPDGKKKQICLGKEISPQEARNIDKIKDTPEFKQRSGSVLLDQHDFHDSRDELREELEDKIHKCAEGASMIDTCTKGAEAASKYKNIPGGVESVRSGLTKAVIDAIKTGQKTIVKKVMMEPKTKAPQKGLMDIAPVKHTPQTQRGTPQGLMQ